MEYLTDLRPRFFGLRANSKRSPFFGCKFQRYGSHDPLPHVGNSTAEKNMFHCCSIDRPREPLCAFVNTNKKLRRVLLQVRLGTEDFSNRMILCVAGLVNDWHDVGMSSTGLCPWSVSAHLDLIMLVLMLDTKQHVIGINTVSIGSLDSSLAHPREVFKPAIIANPASIILAHNHPSGDPMPSHKDRRVTERLVQAGKILGIEVLDRVKCRGTDGSTL